MNKPSSHNFNRRMSDSVPVFSGEVVEVDELGRGPDQPLGQVQPRAELQGLGGEAGG